MLRLPLPLLLACLLAANWCLVDAGRHDRSRSLNELLIDSQSARHLPDFVTKLSPRPSQRSDDVTAAVTILPTRRQSREKKLRRRLGADFDEQWMSVTAPTVAVSEAPSPRADRELMAELASINASLKVGGDKGVVTLTPQIRKLVDLWLLQRASCPVTFVWDDLGGLFWPRWVKRGVCGGDSGVGRRRDADRKYGPDFTPRRTPDQQQRDGNTAADDGEEEGEGEGVHQSCSWPSGMHCVPAESRTLRVLRWHCYPRHSRKSRRGGPRDQRYNQRQRQGRLRNKCTWIKVPYPVTSECYCSC